MPLVRDNATTLYQQIAGTLRDEIAGGRFNPSGRLPSEAEIGARFDVSRVTVRLALDELAGTGLIERRKGKGTYVTGTQVRHDLDTLRSFHESLLLQGLNASMRILSLQSQATPPEIAAAFGSGWETCLFIERLHLVDNEPIALGRSFLPATLQGISRDQAEGQPAYALLAGFVGQDLERASVTLAAQSADRDLETALLVPRGTALLVMERTSYFAHNIPAERSTFYVRPERYRFALNSFFQQPDRAQTS